ncbi:Adenylate kinase chloroplastic [Melia azedarach]|uniref:Adenylate kinase chloroplastic n=2 Tax=Melia azedarach TaxID=155640 RepID=A0ACC1XQH6_MELAZ|nr:Adenylate kinase chloroplastic [Melia azedarach]KAJ4713739.1 Adenylate kinase chloroplastic [Melia azedarach]
MATLTTVNYPTNVVANAFSPSSSTNPKLNLSSQLSFSSNHSGLSLHLNETTLRRREPSSSSPNTANFAVVASAKVEPLKIMISGAPASGKGTQCELITKKYGLVHIAAGDLLRAEVSAGSKNGMLAREYMEKGQLVPNEIVVMMVKERLSQPDSQEKGWLLDGYPRSSSQATALKKFGFQPDLFILLEVPEDILVERVVGRRLDPVTGKIYHLKYSPPETEEIAARLTQRFDDTEEKVKLRLQTHHQNVEAVLSMYEDITIKVDGSVGKEDVFAQIEVALTNLLEQRKSAMGSLAA